MPTQSAKLVRLSPNRMTNLPTPNPKTKFGRLKRYKHCYKTAYASMLVISLSTEAIKGMSAADVSANGCIDLCMLDDAR